MTTTTDLVWIAKSEGKGRWYESACGRFSITRNTNQVARYGVWRVTDRYDLDRNGYAESRVTTTLAAAKGKAERVVTLGKKIGY